MVTQFSHFAFQEFWSSCCLPVIIAAKILTSCRFISLTRLSRNRLFVLGKFESGYIKTSPMSEGLSNNDSSLGLWRNPNPMLPPFSGCWFSSDRRIIAFQSSHRAGERVREIDQVQMLQRSLFLGDSAFFFLNKWPPDCFKPLIFQGSEKADWTILSVFFCPHGGEIFNSQVPLTSLNHWVIFWCRTIVRWH